MYSFRELSCTIISDKEYYISNQTQYSLVVEIEYDYNNNNNDFNNSRYKRYILVILITFIILLFYQMKLYLNLLIF